MEIGIVPDEVLYIYLEKYIQTYSMEYLIALGRLIEKGYYKMVIDIQETSCISCASVGFFSFILTGFFSMVSLLEL